MATVYRAMQHSLGRPVAVKILARGPDDQDDFAQRFKKEGRILARLLHPNIVTIYDIGVSEDNQLFLSMEYLAGGTLRDRIKRGLPFESTIHIIRTIAKAIGYAHEKGVIHRDVKPSNIMFRHDGTPVLTDFGVARVMTGSSTVRTMTGLTVGSPGYMSPEQAMCHGVTVQSDLYSLGVVLYEMLAGYPPYQADSSLAVVLKHLHDPIPGLPREHANLQPILNKLLAKKPTDRYRDISEFLAALNCIVPGDTGSQPKATTGGSPLAMVEFASGTLRNLWLKRPRRFLWLGMISVSVLLIVVVYAFRSRTATESSEAMPKEPPQPVVANTAPVSRETEIATLLQQAEARLKAGLLTDEAEESAEAAYRQVLKLDRGNALALAGLENIAREYERLARQRLDAGAPRESVDPIQKGLVVAPGHAGLVQLRQVAEQRIAERKAQIAERERQQELRLQAEQYLENARSSFTEGLLEISQAHIEQGLQAVPDHPDLLALRDQVKARIAETAQRRAEEARRQAEEAERRKTEKAQQEAAAERRRREVDQSLARAVEARWKNDYAASSQFIEQGLEKVPNHDGLLRLREEVAREVAEAKTRQEREEQRRRQAEQFLAQAQGSFQQGALDASLTQIEQGLAVMPNHPGLLAVRDQVKTRLAEQIRQQAEAQRRQQEEEAQRQAAAAARRRQTEQARQQAELARRQQEEEARRQAEEAERRKAEQARQQAELARRQQEADQSLARAVELRQKGDLAASLQQTQEGLALVPDHAELLRLGESIRTQLAAEQKRQAELVQREQEIKTLLEQAEGHLKAKRLITPAGKNAQETYRQVLKLDVGNTQARAGLERIAQEYLQQARQRRSVGALQDCLGLIDKGLAVIPDQVDLLRLREEVRAEWSAEQQRLEQQRQSEQQQKEQQRKEQQRLEQQRQSEQQQKEQQLKEQQRKLERQQQQEQQQQRLEQQRQEEKQRDQQKKLEQQQRQQEQQRQEQQQRLEQQRKEQQRLEQQRQEEKQRQEQQRKLEQQRQENLPQKPTQPETTAKPRVFGTF